MMSDEELAKVTSGVSIDKLPTGEDAAPLLSLVGELVVQATRIANNTDRPVLHINAADAEKAWESTGMRIYGDAFIAGLKALGIVIDE